MTRRWRTLRLQLSADLRGVLVLAWDPLDVPGIEIGTENQTEQVLPCSVVNTDLDGRDLALADALDEVVGSTYGTLVICVPGKLAYYEGEEQGERYILHRGA